MRRKRKRVALVPREFMVPIGVEGTDEFNKCADNWTDSEIRNLRCRLPSQYHSVPEDWLRQEWVNIRKKGTPGYNVGGHGPGKCLPSPAWYQSYINGEHWAGVRKRCLEFWDYSCALCESTSKVEVHHRTYRNLRRERENDVVALCSKCHRKHHRSMPIPADTPTVDTSLQLF